MHLHNLTDKCLEFDVTLIESNKKGFINKFNIEHTENSISNTLGL